VKLAGCNLISLDPVFFGKACLHVADEISRDGGR
jgi:hypothetical protein